MRDNTSVIIMLILKFILLMLGILSSGIATAVLLVKHPLIGLVGSAIAMMIIVISFYSLESLLENEISRVEQDEL